ncbi:MAG: DUF1272 domain-containing protein [Marinicella sp.]
MVINSYYSIPEMLEMRSKCERCEKALANHQTDVYICSYECTFCNECVNQELKNTCPNCGGELVLRPSRIQKN